MAPTLMPREVLQTAYRAPSRAELWAISRKNRNRQYSKTPNMNRKTIDRMIAVSTVVAPPRRCPRRMDRVMGSALDGQDNGFQLGIVVSSVNGSSLRDTQSTVVRTFVMLKKLIGLSLKLLY